MSYFRECFRISIPGSTDLPIAEREDLLGRLKRETDNMKRNFAVLVGKTLDHLLRKGKTVKDLSARLTSLNGRNENKLTKKLKKITDISDAFIALNKFWSFFDYDILSCIIEGFCSELEPTLNKYLSSLKEFCKRRVCEIPSVCNKETVKLKTKKSLYIQIDKSFVAEINRIKMKDLKELANILGELLGTSLIILKVSDGSIVITFSCLHEFDVIFPLCIKQEEKLKKIGVTLIYSKEREYFRYSPSLTEESLLIASEVASK